MRITKYVKPTNKKAPALLHLGKLRFSQFIYKPVKKCKIIFSFAISNLTEKPYETDRYLHGTHQKGIPRMLAPHNSICSYWGKATLKLTSFPKDAFLWRQEAENLQVRLEIRESIVCHNGRIHYGCLSRIEANWLSFLGLSHTDFWPEIFCRAFSYQ